MLAALRLVVGSSSGAGELLTTACAFSDRM